jgi:hypothetical protein
MTFTVSKTVSDETLNCIITIESAGKVNAKASTSSATGLGQFIDATWIGVVSKHRPDIMADNTKAAVLKMRTDPSFAIEMLARFTEDNQRVVGMNCSGGDLYLAHFLGSTAAQHVYVADPSMPCEPLVGQAAVKANKSILQGKTAGQVRGWAAKRMFQSGGHAWIAKYYTPPEGEAEDPPAEADVEEPAAEDIPDTQSMPSSKIDSPAASVTKDDPEIIGKPPTEKEPGGDGWGAWAIKLAKSKIQWAATSAGALSLTSISGLFQDWRVLAVIGGVIVCLTIIIVVERGRKP